MKKMTYFVMALALVLGLSQCKKEQTPPNNQTEGVFITLNVNGGNNNSRVNVNPTGADGYATVAFENGDVIYVGYKNNYVGSLNYSGGTFSGTVSISEKDYGEKLHFYFLGGVGFTPTIDETNHTATVNISNQTTRYPVISYNTSDRDFDGTGAYSSKLKNKVSIMKFNVTTDSEAAICITGMNNTVTVNFTDPTGTDNGFTYAKLGTGEIKMKGQTGTGEKTYWAILLPQEPVGVSSAYDEDMAYIGTRPAIGAIGSNEYHNADFSMNVNTPLSTPITLEALTTGTIEVDISGGGSTPPSPWASKGFPGGGSSSISMKYSKNGGEKQTITSTTTINVNAGDKVQFYGDGTTTTSYKGTKISGTALVKAYGNIMSLVDETGFATSTTLATEAFYELFKDNTYLTDASDLLLPAETLAQSCYESMFDGCTSLTKTPALPATTLAKSCYFSMFYGCTALTVAPALPAGTMANSCYKAMFDGCTALTAAPALPAETLADDCYSMMFLECTALTAAPALPATTLAQFCYDRMFLNCTSLTTAPTLPATTMVNCCYSQMFYGCTSLNSVTCLATDINADYTGYWLYNVATTGTFTKASGASWPTGSNGIPFGWTVNEQ